MTDYMPWHLTAEDQIYEDLQDIDYEPDETERTLWFDGHIADDDYNPKHVRERSPAGGANLVSSLTTAGTHAPALDIDFNARLVPSRTKGHFHLYLDKHLPWWKYRILLKVLAWCGIIEPGYYQASVARKMTMLRWNLDDYWHRTGGKQELVVADLLQIRAQTSTVQPTEPKET